MMGDWWGWGMGFGWISMILFWGLVAFAIVALVKWLTPQSPGGASPRERTPLEILEQRYARGEIDREEFEQKRRDLASRA